jgi:hypothetical protein
VWSAGVVQGAVLGVVQDVVSRPPMVPHTSKVRVVHNHQRHPPPSPPPMPSSPHLEEVWQCGTCTPLHHRLKCHLLPATHVLLLLLLLATAAAHTPALLLLLLLRGGCRSPTLLPNTNTTARLPSCCHSCCSCGVCPGLRMACTAVLAARHTHVTAAAASSSGGCAGAAAAGAARGGSSGGGGEGGGGGAQLESKPCQPAAAGRVTGQHTVKAPSTSLTVCCTRGTNQERLPGAFTTNSNTDATTDMRSTATSCPTPTRQAHTPVPHTRVTPAPHTTHR